MRIFALGACVAVSLAAAVPAFAAEHVVNGGFETGNFSGWVATPGAGSSLFGVDGSAPPHSGNFSAYFGSIGDPDTISQTIATVAGQNYVFSFFLKSDMDTAASDLFRASFGGTTLLNLTSSTAFGYQLYSFNVTAASASSTITFSSRNEALYFDLDDVSLADASVGGAVPEPSTWAMMLLGFGAIGAGARRRPKMTARVRYA